MQTEQALGRPQLTQVERRTTRYAIRRDDGRWLSLGLAGREIVPLWVPEAARAWTWPSMTAAVCAVLDVGGELSAIGPWTVEAV